MTLFWMSFSKLLSQDAFSHPHRLWNLWDWDTLLPWPGKRSLPIQVLPLPLAPTSLLPLLLLSCCIISVSGFLLHGTSQSERGSGAVKQRQDFIHLARWPLESWLETGHWSPGLRAEPYISPSPSSSCLPHGNKGPILPHEFSMLHNMLFYNRTNEWVVAHTYTNRFLQIPPRCLQTTSQL